MTSKLYWHIIEPHRFKQYDQAVVNSRASVKVVGAHNELGILSYYHSKNPSAMYIARVWDYEQAIKDMLAAGRSAQDAAVVMYSLLHQFVHAAGMEWCWFECGVNEPNVDDSDTLLAWIDDYYATLVPMLAADGIKSVSYNFSVCHPLLSNWQKLSRSLAAIKSAGPRMACVGLHEYGGISGDIRTYADSQILRHRNIAELQTTPIVITESGREPGWQQIHRSAEDYFADLVWLDQELQKDGNVIGACLYTMDTDPEWAPFRIEGNLAIRLFDHITKENASIVEVPPEPELPPAGTISIRTTSTTGQNVRAYPSLVGRVVDSLNYGEVFSANIDEAASIGLDRAWIAVKGGWAAAWLLAKG